MTPKHPYDDMTLLAYVNGTLDAPTRDLISDALERDAALAAEIALIEGVRRAQRNLTEGAAPGAFGWARLSSAMDHLETVPSEATAGWRAIRLNLMQVAACAAASVIAWQAVAVPLLSNERAPAGSYVPVSDSSIGAVEARILFHETATEQELRTLLKGAHAEIVSGPTAIGFYTLRFPSESARNEAVKTAMDGAEIVETIQIN